MREIKFRAWDGKEMLTGFYLMPADIIVPPAWRKNVGRDVTWMQYTGLKDAKGVEIYEGDYVKSDHDDDEGVVEYGHTGQYVLAQGSFKVSIHSLVFNDWKLEVIGNIYGNPELLNTPLPQ